MADAARSEALQRLEGLVGRWRIEAPFFPDAGPVFSEFEWALGGAFLLQRTEIPVPEAPDSIALYVPAEADGAYTQHYFDSRGIVRLYSMSFDGREWTMARHTPDFSPLPFHQRWVSRVSDDGGRIDGRWEKSDDGRDWELDFELTYTRNNA